MEAMLHKELTDEQLYDLVLRKWEDDLFKQVRKVEEINESTNDLVIFHDIHGQLLEGKTTAKEDYEGEKS